MRSEVGEVSGYAMKLNDKLDSCPFVSSEYGEGRDQTYRESPHLSKQRQ